MESRINNSPANRLETDMQSLDMSSIAMCSRSDAGG